MIHATFPDEATPLVSYWLERILRYLENHNFASSILNFLGIYGNTWLSRRGYLVLIVSQSLEAKLMFRQIPVVIDTDDNKAPLKLAKAQAVSMHSVLKDSFSSRRCISCLRTMVSSSSFVI